MSIALRVISSDGYLEDIKNINKYKRVNYIFSVLMNKTFDDFLSENDEKIAEIRLADIFNTIQLVRENYAMEISFYRNRKNLNIDEELLYDIEKTNEEPIGNIIHKIEELKTLGKRVIRDIKNYSPEYMYIKHSVKDRIIENALNGSRLERW